MHTPHELRDEFPQEISLIERMIRTNYEFRQLADRYDEVNRNDTFGMESERKRAPTRFSNGSRSGIRSSRMRLQRESSRNSNIDLGFGFGHQLCTRTFSFPLMALSDEAIQYGAGLWRSP